MLLNSSLYCWLLHINCYQLACGSHNMYVQKCVTVDGFIFMGTNFHGLKKIQTFKGFKTCGHSIFFHNSYKKLLFHWHWNSWMRLPLKPRKLVPHENEAFHSILIYKVNWIINITVWNFFDFHLLFTEKIFRTKYWTETPRIPIRKMNFILCIL